MLKPSEAIFEKKEMVSFFLCELSLTLKVSLKWKQTERRYLQEFERDWSDGFRGFFREKPTVSHYWVSNVL